MASKPTSKSYQAGAQGQAAFDPRNSAHPQLAKFDARLETFRDWRGKANKEELAEAGMYANHDEDRAVCFHCNITLKEWESHDNPWIEHARFSSCCPFLMLCKGIEFITSSLEYYDIVNGDFEALKNQHRLDQRILHSTAVSEIDQASVASRTRSPHHRQQQQRQSRGIVRRVEPRELRSRLDTTQSKQLIDLGYPRELVGQVIGEQLQTQGDDFRSYAEFVEAVIGAAEMLGIALHTTRYQY
jgi:hypothetical protein